MTEDHRFWSITDDDWVELQDLDTSDVLLTPDGATVTVDFLDWDAGVTTDAYDLTVDEEHNFFVTADTTGEPLLVHNETQGAFCGVPVSPRHAALLGADEVLDDISRAALGDSLRALGEQSPALLDDAFDALLVVGDSAATRELVGRAGEFPRQFGVATENGWVDDYLTRDFLWSDEPLTFDGEVTRVVNFREPGPNPPGDWGVTDVHLERHFFGDGDISLTRTGAGDLPRWLDATEELLSSTPQIPSDTRVGSDGVVREFQILGGGTFPRANGGEFQIELVVHVRPDGNFDFVTWRTSFPRINR